MANYRNIQSVEQLFEAYNLNPQPSNIITEKKGDGKADEDVKQTTFLKDKLEVKYADLKEVSNIFKHIIVFTNDRDTKNNKT